MTIKILGPGCKNCTLLEQRTREAVSELQLNTEIEKVTDYGEIAGYGVMKTPGLVLGDVVLVSGKVPTTSEIKRLISEHS